VIFYIRKDVFKIEEIIKNEIEECLIPTPGDCWNPHRLVESNCEGCKYWNGCSYRNKGKMTVAEKKIIKTKTKKKKK
jgi:hypothetical protein